VFIRGQLFKPNLRISVQFAFSSIFRFMPVVLMQFLCVLLLNSFRLQASSYKILFLLFNLRISA